MKKNISFLGAGKMAEALISGILSAGSVDHNKITASDISKNRLDFLSSKYKINVTCSNVKAVEHTDIIFLSVKPQQSNDVLHEIRQYSAGKLFISIMAGIKLGIIEKSLDKARVIRVMPNTPALVGKGISAIAKGTIAKTDDLETARLLLKNVGQVIILKDENLMDAVTALSGSGPAYFYWLSEILIEAGMKMGLSADEAQVLSCSTFTGAAELLDKTKEDVGKLRQNVTSPGGTTEAALNFLKEHNTKEIIINAVKTAEKRSKEMSKKI